MSTLSAVTFLEQFPEFEPADLKVVEARLALAHRAFGEDVLGDVYLDAVGLKTAHLLASDPLSKEMRLAKNSSETVYQYLLTDLLAGVPSSGVTVP